MSIGLVGRTPGALGRLRLHGKNRDAAKPKHRIGRRPKDQEFSLTDHLVARLTGWPLKRKSLIADVEKAPTKQTAIAVNDGGIKAKLRNMTTRFHKTLGR